MKRNKITCLGLIATSLLLGSLVSCGGNNDSASSNKVYFWHTFGKGIKTQVEKQAKEFEKIIKEKEDVDIEIVLEYQGSYNDLIGKVTKSFTVGDTPQICVAYPDHVATYLNYDNNGKKYVNNLETFINDPEIGLDKEEYLNPGLLGESDFVPSFIDEGRHYIYEGTYSLPYMKSTELMLYNKDIVSSAIDTLGIQESVEDYMNDITWDEFMTLVNHINDNKETYFAGRDLNDVRTLFYDSDSNLFITQSYQRDIDFISMKDGKGQIDFVNDEAKDMVREFKTMYDNKALLTKGTNNGEYGSDFFKKNLCAFVVGSTGGSGYSDPVENFPVGVTKFPVYKTATPELSKYISQGVTLALMNNFALSEEDNTFKTKYAWKFMKYITNTKNNIDACLYSEGYVPSRSSCYVDEEYKEYLSLTDYMSVCANTVINQINGNYFNYPVFKGSDVARNQVGAIIAEYLSGKNSDLDYLFNQAANNTKLAMN